MKLQPGPIAFLLAAFAFAPPACILAQQQVPTPEGTGTNPRQPAGPPAPLKPIPNINNARSGQTLQQEHDSLVADTQKLETLVAQLKADLLAGNGMTLSADSIRKATEIEKLSRSIKKRLQS